MFFYLKMCNLFSCSHSLMGENRSKSRSKVANASEPYVWIIHKRTKVKDSKKVINSKDVVTPAASYLCTSRELPLSKHYEITYELNTHANCSVQYQQQMSITVKTIQNRIHNLGAHVTINNRWVSYIITTISNFVPIMSRSQIYINWKATL